VSHVTIRKLIAAGVLSAGLLAAAAGAAVAATAGHSSAPQTRTTAVVHHLKAGAPAAQPKDGPEQSGEEATTPETDGPGGHQDPPGQNIDHQFGGVE
jgi:hypothetical protein